jgi:hypothetical protein
MIPAMCRAYYFEQLDSVGIAMRFGLRAPLMRQILCRLTQLDARIQAGTDTREWKYNASRGAIGKHNRWHAARGIVSPKCVYCAKQNPEVTSPGAQSVPSCFTRRLSSTQRRKSLHRESRRQAFSGRMMSEWRSSNTLRISSAGPGSMCAYS